MAYQYGPLGRPPPPPVDLMAALQRLRAEALNRKLDMTDAFEEYAGTGYERNMGVMDKRRFRSTMGTLFRGAVSLETLNAICHHYRAGHPDPDPSEPLDSYTQVRWKQFAIDFDEVPLPSANARVKWRRLSFVSVDVRLSSCFWKPHWHPPWFLVSVMQ